jgi:para-nitrobenzyl esterase
MKAYKAELTRKIMEDIKMNGQVEKFLMAFVAGSAIAVSMLSGCATSQASDGSKDITVKVTGGLIKGYASSDGALRIFKGIPYAADTGRQNRFKAPQDVKPWEGVKDCADWGDSAMQIPQTTTKPLIEAFIISNKTCSENGLNLNVWTTEMNGKKPVVLYIHGGAYNVSGASADVYDGEEIARKGVVYVSINYRLGIFGFLATSALEKENDGYGNFATLDLIKGLEWIRDNIARFGGDPGNVTIMGQSAGSGMVQSLVASPAAKGLFQRAMPMSLSAFAPPFDTITDRISQGDALSLSLDALRSMSAEEVLKIAWTANGPAWGTGVMPYGLKEAYSEGTANDVDLMSGFVEGDALLFYPFIAGVNPTDPPEQVEKNMMAPQLALAKAVELAGYKGNMYLYYYTYIMPGPVVENPGPYDFGAFHTSDVPYFLNHLSVSRAAYWTDTDRQFAGMLSDYLVNFAKTGNPNGISPAVWKTVRESGSYLLININPAMR